MQGSQRDRKHTLACHVSFAMTEGSMLYIQVPGAADVDTEDNTGVNVSIAPPSAPRAAPGSGGATFISVLSWFHLNLPVSASVSTSYCPSPPCACACMTGILNHVPGPHHHRRNASGHEAPPDLGREPKKRLHVPVHQGFDNQRDRLQPRKYQVSIL